MIQPLMKIVKAVMSGQEAAMRQLLKASPDVVRVRFEQDYLVRAIPHWLYVGDTPLHLAAAALKVSAVRLLLRAGANSNAENRREATPLFYACDARPAGNGTWNPPSQARIIDMLLEHDADPQHVDRGGASALHRAVRARSPVAVRHLLKGGAKVDLRLSKGGSTALHLAVQPTGASGTAGALAEQLEIIAMLLKHGADPMIPDAKGKTARDCAKGIQICKALDL